MVLALFTKYLPRGLKEPNKSKYRTCCNVTTLIRIIGIDYNDISNKSVNLYKNTLPYWIKTTKDNSVWTNEHVGNKIARFVPDNDTLIEYWIPTQNIHYSICDPNQ